MRLKLNKTPALLQAILKNNKQLQADPPAKKPAALGNWLLGAPIAVVLLPA